MLWVKREGGSEVCLTHEKFVLIHGLYQLEWIDHLHLKEGVCHDFKKNVSSFCMKADLVM